MCISWKRLYGATIAVFVLSLCLATGCQNWFLRRDGQGTTPGVRMTSGTPTQQELVAFLNNNAHRLNSLDCEDLDLQASQGDQTIGLMGRMICQKPRNFRLNARAAGTPMVDLGSNQQEFWFWIAKSEPPYLFHCSHQDFAQGRAKMAFPFQPDWIMAALGMAEYDPNKPYEVKTTGRQTIELIETSATPQGQAVRKVTVFQRAPTLQVSGHVLRDMNGKDICTARITAAGRDPASGLTYPRSVQLEWPSDRVRLSMRLSEVTLNSNLDARIAGGLFSRANFNGVQTYNLATGPDAPAQPLQRARGNP